MTESSPLPAAAAAAPGKPSPREIRATILGLMTAMLLAALDQSIVATALPSIGRDLGGFDLVPWVVTAYLLAATVAAPLYGRLADTMGRRVIMHTAIAIFMIGAIASALAPSMLFLACARAIQGLGGGGLVILAQTIIADVVPPKERGHYQVYIAGVFAASNALGPVLGGLIAQHLHWSVIFWLNLPLGAAALWMSDGVLRRAPRHHRPRKLDLIGAALMIGASTTLLLALNWGGVRYGWTSPAIVGLAVASGFLWTLFAARLRTATDPLIPGALLRNPVVACGLIVAGFSMGTHIGLAYFMPIYLQLVVGLEAGNSGLAMIPLLVGTVTGAIIGGRHMPHVRHYKRLPMAGYVVAILGRLALAQRPIGLSLLQTELLFGVVALGVGFSFPIITVSIQNAVVLHHIGTATAAMHFFRQLTGAVVVAVFGAIVLSVGVTAGRGVSTVATAADAAALAESFRWVFLAAAGGIAIALAALALMKELPLRDKVHSAQDTADAAGD